MTAERKRLGILAKERERKKVVWSFWTRPKTEGILWFQNFPARGQRCSEAKHGSTYVFNQREVSMRPVSMTMWNPECSCLPPVLKPPFLITSTKGSSFQWHKSEWARVSARRKDHFLPGRRWMGRSWLCFPSICFGGGLLLFI